MGGTGAAPHAEALSKLLHDKEASVQRAAADALPRLGEAGIAILLKCVGDRDPDVRLRAAETLGRTTAMEGQGAKAFDKTLQSPLSEAALMRAPHLEELQTEAKRLREAYIEAAATAYRRKEICGETPRATPATSPASARRWAPGSEAFQSSRYFCALHVQT